jgi:phosphoserine aminotransferase
MEPPSTPSSGRVYNFSAGPACMPESVLVQLQGEMLNLFGTGIGLLEHSHRGAAYDRLLDEALHAVRSCAGVGPEWEILFMPGGSMQHFPLLAMNFVPKGGSAAFLDTGLWAHKGAAETSRVCTVRTLFDGTAIRYAHVPEAREISDPGDAAYLCYCSNNTVEGTQFRAPPRTNVPLFCDATSDIFSRDLDWNAHELVFASGQKNLGASGICVVFARKSLLARANASLSPMLSYAHFAKTQSRPNTPPTFGVRVIGLMARWTLDHGGTAAFARRAAERSAIVYAAIDRSAGFYRGSSDAGCRSTTAISFQLPSDALVDAFVSEAEAKGLHGLRGHREWGGIRACLYNAFPSQGCALLASFMDDFARRRG